MAKSGRFPLLYWTSIGLLALMLAFSGWYFYKSRNSVCRYSIAEPLMQAELRRHWHRGRVVALMSPWFDCTASGACPQLEERVNAGLNKLLTENFTLWAAADTPGEVLGRKPKSLPWLETGCGAALPEKLSRLGEGNHLLILPKGCLGHLADVEALPGLILFMKKGSAGNAPAVLACAPPDLWSELN